MGDSFKIFFVKSEKDGENDSLMVEAFELLKKGEQDLEVEWISQEDCMSFVIKGKPSLKIFIFNLFEGLSYHHVQKLGCRIYGPLCLISNLKHSMDLPKDTKHPIYSLAMKGIKVCCTSVEKKARDEIQRLVHLMSGEMARDLTADSTHLIAGEVGSIKYMVAQDKGKWIMSKEWVFNVWELAQTKHILGTDEVFKKYKCPSFLGLTVCVSGFNQAERNQMKNFVVRGGGKYSGELKMNECTHLIVKEPKGAKYDAAKNWKIKTVTDKWLFDCVDRGKYLDPKNYNFEKGVKTSTPERLSMAGPNISDVSAISVDASDSTFQQVNETNMLMSSRMSVQLNTTGMTLGETRQDAPFQEMNTTVAPADVFLDGCRVFFSGIEQSMQEKLKKIVTAGGGFRSLELENGVTHLIVGKQIPSDILAASGLTERPFFVRSDWLMDCFHKNSHLPEKAYVVSITDNELQQTSMSTTVCEKEPLVISDDKEVSSLRVGEAESDLQMAELLSQYAAEEGENPGEGHHNVVGKGTEGKGSNTKGDVSMEVAHQEEEMTQDPNAMVDDQEDQSGIFNNKVFIFLGLIEDIKEEMTKAVEVRGGRVVNLNQTRQIPDIAIVPFGGYPVNGPNPEVLTVMWLQMCLEREEWVPGNHWIAKPIQVSEKKPLRDCCISVSGFSGAEKDCLAYLIESLGAVCVSHFARRTTKKLQGCTHLIVAASEGSKYDAAKNWGIPAVGKEWIIDCVKSGERPSEEEYHIDVIEKRCQEEMEIERAKAESFTSNSSLLQRPQESEGNALESNDVQEIEEAMEVVELMPENRTTIGEKSMCMTPCKGQAVEKVQSSSTENSQCSAETDLNPLKEVNRQLKLVNINTPKLSPKIVIDSKGKERFENESLCVGPIKTPVNARLRELAVQDANTSLSTPKGLIRGGGETPGTFMQSGYKLKFDFTGMFSPDTPANAEDLNKSTPLGVVFSRHLERGVQNLVDKKESTPCPSQSQPEQFAPLNGIIIAVAKKLGRNQVEYNNIVVELGGDYTWQYNSSATHFVFQGRPNDTNKEFRKARDDGKFIVSPHWLYMCKEQSCRVDESLFPHHFNPSQALTLVTDKETPLRSKRATTRNKGSKGETPLKAVNVKTPGRKMPVLNLQSMVSTPTKNTESALNNVDEDINKDIDETEKLERANRKSPSHETSPLRHLEEVADKTSEMDSKDEEANRVSDESSKSTKSEEKTNQEMKDPLCKTLETVLAEASSRSRKSSRRKGKRINLGGQRNSSSGNTPENTLTRSGAAGWASKDIGSKDSNSLPEPSQSMQVMWDDTTERLEKEKLAHRLERVCDPSQNTDDCLAAMDLPEADSMRANEHNNQQSTSSDMRRNRETYRSPTPEAPSIAFPTVKPSSTVMSPQPIELISEESSDSRMSNLGNTVKKVPNIMVSGMQDQERVHYGALIEELGGKMMDKQHFDTTCTHLVVTQPMRNEKYFSSVAAGNWVLHKSYFEACRKEGKFVNEENHEWGSDFTLPLMQNMTAMAFKLAAAAHKWRKKISSMKKNNPSCRGAFHGWKIMLCLVKNREQNFQRLLEAGGADVKILKPPFPPNLKFSHAFLDLNKVPLPQDDLETLIRADIHCLKAEYIAAYLTDDPHPDPSDFYPPEITALKACMTDDGLSRKRKSTFDADDDSYSRKVGKFPRS